MAIGSLIQTGLPDLPDERLDPKIFDALLGIHKAIKRVASLVSIYTGIDEPDPTTWDDLSYANTLLAANFSRMYPVADTSIIAGQIINLYNNAGNLRARLADADSATTMAHGIAMTSCNAGERFQMYWLRGLVNTIGGMITGTLYWLSTTAGSIQNVAPAVVGQIQQPIGIALSPSQLLADIPLSYRQL